MTHQKRLPAPKHYPIHRKDMKYISTMKDSRSKENAIPAVLFLREVIGYADTKKEAKKIIRNGGLLRNGEPVTDVREGIGILDVVELPEAEEGYRVTRSGDNLKFVPVTDTEKVVTKITGKAVEGNDFVYRLHNGENYRTDTDYTVGNTLVFEDGEPSAVALEEGAKVLVTGGKHAGEIDTLEEIHERGTDPDTGVVKSEDHRFETKLENLVAVKNVQLGDKQ